MQESLSNWIADGGRWRSATEEGKYWASLTGREGSPYSELWKKMRWAIGTALGVEYSRNSRTSEISRRLSLVVLNLMEEAMVGKERERAKHAPPVVGEQLNTPTSGR